jgi:hypothetical protein
VGKAAPTNTPVVVASVPRGASRDRKIEGAVVLLFRPYSWFTVLISDRIASVCCNYCGVQHYYFLLYFFARIEDMVALQPLEIKIN